MEQLLLADSATVHDRFGPTQAILVLVVSQGDILVGLANMVPQSVVDLKSFFANSTGVLTLFKSTVNCPLIVALHIGLITDIDAQVLARILVQREFMHQNMVPNKIPRAQQIIPTNPASVGLFHSHEWTVCFYILIFINVMCPLNVIVQSARALLLIFACPAVESALLVPIFVMCLLCIKLHLEGRDSIEKLWLEFWLEKTLEYLLEIPYTKKMFKKGYIV